MSDNTRCADPQCSCQHEQQPTTGPGVPISRAVAAVEEWLASVDLVLASDDLRVAA
jgi:hypothetical protein